MLTLNYIGLHLSPCSGGLVDALKNDPNGFSIEQVLKSFYQTCQAVQHMHKQQPPIIHRDLKVSVRLDVLVLALLK